MGGPGGIGRVLIAVGLAVAAVGAVVWLSQYLPPWLRLGRLPGDIRIERPGFSLYVPLTTMVLLSAAASGIVWLIRWWRRQ
jgi:hypothetical protein